MTTLQSDLVAVGAVGEVKENAGSLNLTWELRPATVSSMLNGAVSLVFDGDTNITLAISMVGDLGGGDRVNVIQIPPSGNYVVGFGGGAPMAQMTSFKGNASAPQQVTGTSFVDVSANGVGVVTETLYKYRNSSRIAYNIACDAFATAIGDTVEYGFEIDGTDYAAAGYFFNAAADHRMVVGASILTDSENISAGQYEVTLRWRNPSGNAANMDLNSQLQFQLYEVAPLPE